MKKVLFVLQAAASGGSVTSLLNLLGFLKEKGYESDLFLFQKKGPFIERAAEAANLLDEEKIISSVVCSKQELKGRGVKALLIRCAFVICHKLLGERRAMKLFYRASAKKLSGRYDTVIAYQESLPTEYVRYIKADKKIAWVHTMYEKFTVNKSHEMMLSLYSDFDGIVCVAQAAVEAFQRGLPELADRVSLIPNPLNATQIIEKSKQAQEDISVDEQNIIVSLGRLSKEKQYDMAIKTAKMLRDTGLAFKWYIIGDGSERANLEKLIKDEALEGTVMLLGLRNNPYPLLARADVLVISSLYEAQPMVANEALILGVPVITTNYPSAKTLIDDGKNGIICDMSEAGLYNALSDYFTNEALQRKLKEEASSFHYDSDCIVETVLSKFIV